MNEIANLTEDQLRRAACLLYKIVCPGDHDFYPEIEEAQKLLNCVPPAPQKQPRRWRSAYAPKRKRGVPIKMKRGWKPQPQ